MHEHDQELIMALAEGTLDNATAAAAETALAGCDECLRDLELQRIAIEALHGAPAVYLSAIESARLHEALKDELAMTPAPDFPTRRSSVAWGRWAGLAVGAAAMFLGAILLAPALLGGGGDSDTVSFEGIQDRAATESATATTAAATAATAAPSATMAAPSIGLDDSPEGGDGAAASEDSFADTGAAILAYEIEGDLTEEFRSEIVDRLMVDFATFAPSDQAAKNIAPRLDVCIEELVNEAIPDNAEVLVLGTATGADGQERLLVVYVTPDLEDSVIAALDLPRCEVYQTIP